jgi:metallo-beta-lactamase class B
MRGNIISPPEELAFNQAAPIPMKQSLVLLLGLIAMAGASCFAQARRAAPLPVSQDKEAAERMFESWKPPMTPFKVVGNVYYVGLSGVCSWLITTPEGDILIDTTFEECVPSICTNIEKLGFHVGDIKLILSSHAHVDHVGGHAEMKRRTGAKVVASAADARVMETGGADDFSPFPKEMLAYKPVKADRIVSDGDLVTLGGVTLTAHLTPGHTRGATTWTMPVLDGGRTNQVVFFSSMSLVEPTRLLNNPAYPNIVEDYRETFKKLKALRCDVFLAPHGDQFGLPQKVQRMKQHPEVNPFFDTNSLPRLITRTENALDRQLAAEKSGK